MRGTHRDERNAGPRRNSVMRLVPVSIVIAALGGTIFAMGVAPAAGATARPAPAAANVSAVPADWTFGGIYPTKAACVAAGTGVQGIAGGAKTYKCTAVTTRSVTAWYLYVEY